MYERLEPLVRAGKLGPIVWQLPPNFRRDDERLAAACCRSASRGRHCIEFRHPELVPAEPCTPGCGMPGVALVIADHPKWPFQAHELTTDWTLVRLHHGRRGRRGNYSRRELEDWARRIRGWRRRSEVFVYLNNDWEGFAVDNARTLKRLLQRPPAG